MRATLNIPEALINDLIVETGEKNKTLLVKKALEEMLRTIRRRKLIGMSGKLDCGSWVGLNSAKASTRF